VLVLVLLVPVLLVPVLLVPVLLVPVLLVPVLLLLPPTTNRESVLTEQHTVHFVRKAWTALLRTINFSLFI
jgi:hypothetical protein